MITTKLIIVGMIEIFIIAMCHFSTKKEVTRLQATADIVDSLMRAIGDDEDYSISEVVDKIKLKV